jgi:hypothetical protein
MKKKQENQQSWWIKGTKKPSTRDIAYGETTLNTVSRELSRFSKHLRFLSLQILQKMQIGTIFHVVVLLDLPNFHQQATRSSTLLGMTQEIPKREKMLFHRADATSQCRRIWSTDSPSRLHGQHLSTMIMCLFLRLSKVRILPRAADQVKKVAIGGAWDCHTLFQGNRVPPEHVKEPK